MRRQINPKLQIDGILLTMVDSRTNYAKEISALLRDTYGGKIKVFATDIPHSVRAAEISAEGKSIFARRAQPLPTPAVARTSVTILAPRYRRARIVSHSQPGPITTCVYNPARWQQTSR